MFNWNPNKNIFVTGLLRESNPGPLAPKARIIALHQAATLKKPILRGVIMLTFVTLNIAKGLIQTRFGLFVTGLEGRRWALYPHTK